jgi:hypothetical protein
LIRSWLVRRFWNSKIWIGNILVGDGDLEDWKVMCASTARL